MCVPSHKTKVQHFMKWRPVKFIGQYSNRHIDQSLIASFDLICHFKQGFGMIIRYIELVTDLGQLSLYSRKILLLYKNVTSRHWWNMIGPSQRNLFEFRLRFRLGCCELESCDNEYKRHCREKNFFHSLSLLFN